MIIRVDLHFTKYKTNKLFQGARTPAESPEAKVANRLSTHKIIDSSPLIASSM